MGGEFRRKGGVNGKSCLNIWREKGEKCKTRKCGKHHRTFAGKIKKKEF